MNEESPTFGRDERHDPADDVGRVLVVLIPPDPGSHVLACAECEDLIDLADLRWRCDTPPNVVSTIICAGCAGDEVQP